MIDQSRSLVTIVMRNSERSKDVSTVLRSQSIGVQRFEEWPGGWDPRASAALLLGPSYATPAIVKRETRRHPHLSVVAAVRPKPVEWVQAVIRSGAVSAVPTHVAVATLAQASFAALRGEALTTPALLDELVSSGDYLKLQSKGLTREQIQLLRALVDGLTMNEVADKLHCSVRTVHRRVRSTFHALGVTSKNEAIALAGYHGILPHTSAVDRDSSKNLN